MRNIFCLFLTAFFALFTGSSSLGQSGGLNLAEPIGKYLNGLMPPETPRAGSGSFLLTNAFPKLTFIDPLQMIPVPGTVNQVMVIEKIGRLVVFENRSSVNSKTVLFDIRDVVESRWDSGMVGVAFHPEFGQVDSPNRDYLYVYYKYQPEGFNNQNSDQGYCRLSRFTWTQGNDSIDTASEQVLINQYDRHNWHNGGGIFFGDDGFLYLSIGDEGGANDQFQTGQKRNVGLLAGVFRIDVDRDPSRSHPIRRQPRNPSTPPHGWESSYSQHYYIPNDNPWLSTDGSQLEEFYALGTRSPHRMTQDPVTGRIWLGDIGQGSREEISNVVKGANLQWPYKEGSINGPRSKPRNLTGFDQPPIYDYNRSVGGCVIGGYVYRGSRHPELVGKYLFGDHNTSRIWSLEERSGQSPLITNLATMQRHGPGPKNGLSSFGIDQNGEIYVLSLAGTDQDGGVIYKLDRTNAGIPEPPAKLSQTGAFSNLSTLTPASGVMPYGVNQPLWSDGAEKKRWIAIPNDGNPDTVAEKIGFSETENWDFPDGTVLIKHFELGGRRLETRFFVRTRVDDWYGVTYKWNASGTDADLLPGPPVEESFIADGKSYLWHYPGRNECFICHTQAAGTTLGVKTRHLNGDLTYQKTGRTANQLVTLNDLGFFSPSIDTSEVDRYLKTHHIADATASLEKRARSYMDINCSQCHRPNGPVQANFDATLDASPHWQNIINVVPNDALGITDAKIIKPGDTAKSILYRRANTLDRCCAMPPIAKNVIDDEAMTVIAAWINSLENNTAPQGPSDGNSPIDYVPPTVIFSGGGAVSGPFQVLVNFSETVSGLSVEDFSIVNGVATSLSGSDASYVLSITPTAAGPGSIQLDSDEVIDAVGNANFPSQVYEFSYSLDESPGLRYDYYEKELEAIPDFSTLTPTKSGVVANFDLTVADRPDAYLLRFYGNISISTAGNYTFYLNSDDGSKLWIDGQLVVDNDGLHDVLEESGAVDLTAGTHTFEVGFLEWYGGEVLDVLWSGPGIVKQAIPNAVFTRPTGSGNLAPQLTATPDQSSSVGQSVNLALVATDPDNDPIEFNANDTLPTGLTLNSNNGMVTGSPTEAGIFAVSITASDGKGGTTTDDFTWAVGNGDGGEASPGLRYDYYEGDWSDLPDFTNLTPKKSGLVSTVDLSPRLRDDIFAFRYSGDITINTPGAYTFYLTSDDGSKLWIDGQQVIDNGGLHDVIEVSATRQLSAGKHAIEIGFLESYGGEVLIVEFEGPGFARQTLPSALLTHGGGGNFAPDLTSVPDLATNIGQTVNLSLTATDPDDDPLTFAETGLPIGLTLNSSTGKIMGQPTSVGIYLVTLSVTDGQGGLDRDSFIWSINDPNSGSSPGLDYEYYEQEFELIPNFNTLTPTTTGVVASPTLSVAERDDAYVLRFLGEISIDTAGSYTFFTESDDGSRLWIDGQLVVDNDGLHDAFEASGNIELAAGNHTIEIAFLEWYGGELLNVSMSGPGISKGPIPTSRFSRTSSLPSLTLSGSGSEGIQRRTGRRSEDASPLQEGQVGHFKGLLIDLDDGQSIVGGLTKFKLSKNGKFSGSLARLGKKPVHIKGIFGEDGRAREKLKDGSILGLQLVESTEGYQLLGGITGSAVQASLEAAHSSFDRKNPTDLAGSYTMVMPTLGNEGHPAGDSYATIKVRTDGRLTARGVLGDSTKVNITSFVTADEEWFLFKELYKAPKGLIGGRLLFRDIAGVSDFDGYVHWRKLANSKEKLFPEGFDTTQVAIGSAFDLTDPFPIGGATLAYDFSGDESVFGVEIDNKGKVTIPGTKEITGKLNLRTGEFRGMHKDLATKKRTTLGGAVFQKQTIVSGVAIRSKTDIGPMGITPVE